MVLALEGDLEGDKRGMECCLRGSGELGREGAPGLLEGRNAASSEQSSFQVQTQAAWEWHGGYRPR